jgi:hypothetical protein
LLLRHDILPGVQIPKFADPRRASDVNSGIKGRQRSSDSNAGLDLKFVAALAAETTGLQIRPHLASGCMRSTGARRC